MAEKIIDIYGKLHTNVGKAVADAKEIATEEGGNVEEKLRTLEEKIDEKPDVTDVKEDVVSLITDEQGNSAVSWSEKDGLDANKLSSKLEKQLANKSVARVKEDSSIPNIKDTYEDTVSLVTDNLGNSAVSWSEKDGLDANKLSSKLEKQLANKSVARVKEDSSIPNIKDTYEETVSLVTDEQGNSAVNWSEKDGLDANKLSPRLEDYLRKKLDIRTNLICEDIKEDYVSLLTDYGGNSAVGWYTKHGFDFNALTHHAAKLIRDRYVKDMTKWQMLGTGMFIHWGVYSVLEGHYEGTNSVGEPVDFQSTGIAEWILYQARIPKETYKTFQGQFTAANWDADKVAEMAYNAGMKYIVITCKHHEGFVLFDSKFAEWNISATPARVTVLDELKAACDKYGLKFCIYFSQATDWTTEGGFGQDFYKNDDNDPFNSEQHKAYVVQTMNVLKEIMDRFNPYVLWYDAPRADSDEYMKAILEMQQIYYPQVIVNPRLFYSDLYDNGDFETGEGSYYTGNYPYAENCYTTNGSWGYNKAYDTAEHQKKASDIVKLLILEAKARTQNALINVGPKADGTIPTLVAQAFSDVGKFMAKYGTMEGCVGLQNMTFPNWGRVIRQGNTLKCYIYDKSASIKVQGINTRFLHNVIVYDKEGDRGLSNVQIIDDYSFIVKNIPVREDGYPGVVDVEFNNNIVFKDYSNEIGLNEEITALAFNCYGPVLTSTLEIGAWHFGHISTVFKYTGDTGDYRTAIKSTMDGGSSTLTVKLDSGDEITRIEMDNKNLTSSSTVHLVKNKVYKITISKDGAWFNLSNIKFIK